MNYEFYNKRLGLSVKHQVMLSLRFPLSPLRLQRGFSVLEVLLASVIFIVFSSAAVMIILQAFNANRLGQENSIATQFAAEGLEAVRSIRNQGYTNIDGLASTYCSSGTGVQLTGGVWVLKAAGTTDTLSSDSRFIRTITICDAQRTATASSDLGSSGTTYENVKKITATVTWKFKTSQTNANSVSLVSYLSNWRSKKGGMLVYGNGGTTSNAIGYQIYDASTDTWSSSGSFTVSPTGYALRAVRIYASPTRNEKIMVARFYNGTAQQIWAAVYDGDAGSWGHAQQLAPNGTTWNASTFLDVRNFDGSYLNNGTFLVVYSNNNATPRYATWDGTSWNVNNAMTALSGTPIYIVTKTRPGTNEVLAAFTNSASDTQTEYYNGSSWTLHTPAHATTNTTNTKELVDFAWITNTQGALIYSAGSSGTSARVITTRIFTADGSGGGSWGSAVNSPQVGGTNQVGPINLDVRNYINEYNVCNKTSGNQIVCFKSDLTTSWSTPTNNTIATATETGIERSYDIAYENVSGAQSIVVYSDNTSTPKLKKYNPVTSTFDAAATSLTAVAGTVTGIRSVGQPAGDDIMFLIFDTTRKVSTIVWDGSNNAMYASGGKAMTGHGTNGSATTEFWANFAWDKF